jgi:hypothetical protein
MLSHDASNFILIMLLINCLYNRLYSMSMNYRLWISMSLWKSEKYTKTGNLKRKYGQLSSSDSDSN